MLLFCDAGAAAPPPPRVAARNKRRYDVSAAAAAQVAAAVESGDAMFGTVDSWLIYCLTGGADGGVHVTDGEQQQQQPATLRSKLAVDSWFCWLR